MESKIPEDIISTLLNYLRYKSPMNILIHGDIWLNNSMFRKGKGEEVECRLLDLQIARFVKNCSSFRR